jgi:hypothetical protein
MAAIVVEFERFLEVQQRRAGTVPQAMARRRETSPETNGSERDDYPLDVGESRQQFDPTPDQAAPARDSTTRESLDG